MRQLIATAARSQCGARTLTCSCMLAAGSYVQVMRRHLINLPAICLQALLFGPPDVLRMSICRAAVTVRKAPIVVPIPIEIPTLKGETGSPGVFPKSSKRT